MELLIIKRNQSQIGHFIFSWHSHTHRVTAWGNTNDLYICGGWRCVHGHSIQISTCSKYVLPLSSELQSNLQEKCTGTNLLFVWKVEFIFESVHFSFGRWDCLLDSVTFRALISLLNDSIIAHIYYRSRVENVPVLTHSDLMEYLANIILRDPEAATQDQLKHFSTWVFTAQ